MLIVRPKAEKASENRSINRSSSSCVGRYEGVNRYIDEGVLFILEEDIELIPSPVFVPEVVPSQDSPCFFFW